MIQLSKKRVDEFKTLFEKRYGVKYSDEEAHEAAHNLINFFYTLWGIDQRLKKEKNNKLKL